MKRFKTLILGFVVTMAFAACGEGFKAKINGGDSTGDINPPASQTPAAVDETMAREFGFEPQASNQVSSLAQEIGAFEITTEVVVHPGGASENLRSLSASLMGTSCNSQVVNIQNTSATLEQLRSRSRLLVGASDQYEVEVRCSNSNCSELVAIVRRSSSDLFANTPVLYALAATSTETIDRTVRTTYTSRQTEVSVYRTALSLEQKFNSCFQGPFQPTAGDPTQGDFAPQNNQTAENNFFFPQNQAL